MATLASRSPIQFDRDFGTGVLRLRHLGFTPAEAQWLLRMAKLPPLKKLAVRTVARLKNGGD